MQQDKDHGARAPAVDATPALGIDERIADELRAELDEAHATIRELRDQLSNTEHAQIQDAEDAAARIDSLVDELAHRDHELAKAMAELDALKAAARLATTELLTAAQVMRQQREANALLMDLVDHFKSKMLSLQNQAQTP